MFSRIQFVCWENSPFYILAMLDERKKRCIITLESCKEGKDMMDRVYTIEEIKADFNALYQAMNGIPLREMDKVIYPVCKLCRNHEQAGFIEGIKVGMLLSEELSEG